LLRGFGGGFTSIGTFFSESALYLALSNFIPEATDYGDSADILIKFRTRIDAEATSSSFNLIGFNLDAPTLLVVALMIISCLIALVDFEISHVSPFQYGKERQIWPFTDWNGFGHLMVAVFLSLMPVNSLVIVGLMVVDSFKLGFSLFGYHVMINPLRLQFIKTPSLFFQSQPAVELTGSILLSVIFLFLLFVFFKALMVSWRLLSITIRRQVH